MVSSAAKIAKTGTTTIKTSIPETKIAAPRRVERRLGFRFRRSSKDALGRTASSFLHQVLLQSCSLHCRHASPAAEPSTGPRSRLQ
jgi:hypothetical protein